MATTELHRRLAEPEHIDRFDEDPPTNRRIYERLKASELDWLRGATVKYGGEVRVLDISAGGLLLETQQPLKPNSSVVLQLTLSDSPILVPSKVLRCRVSSLSDIVTYQGACAFKRPLTMRELNVQLTSATAHPAISLAHTVAKSFAGAKIVARLNDGRIVRGYANDFDPFKTHLHISSDRRDDESTIIPLSDLKTLFVVREFSGHSTRVEADFAESLVGKIAR